MLDAGCWMLDAGCWMSLGFANYAKTLIRQWFDILQLRNLFKKLSFAATYFIRKVKKIRPVRTGTGGHHKIRHPN
jgi:hypothetical protein